MDKLFEAKLAKNLKEICLNCNFPKGSHNAVGYYSNKYNKYIPLDCCPGYEERINWDKGLRPQSNLLPVFKPSGKYKREDNEN